MKAISFTIVFVLFLFLSGSFPQALSQARNQDNVVNTEFRALGLCGMCKTRIERAALSVRGVRSAAWDQQKQMVAVRFDSTRTNQEAIERAIARVGHDTQNFITDEETYKNLHHCCKYPRDPQMLRNNRVHNQIQSK